MRILNAYRMEDGVVCVPGMETGFTACSPGELLRGVDATIHETTVDWQGDQGIHISDYKRIRRIHNLKYAGTVGGCNTNILRHEVAYQEDGQSTDELEGNEVDALIANSMFLASEESSSMMLMVLPAEQGLRNRPFLYSTGFSPLDMERNRGTDDYPYSVFWTKYFGINLTAQSFQEVNTRAWAQAMTPALAMFRSKMMYPRVGGGMELIPGETHHGYEGKGAQLVRRRGETVYPVTTIN